MKGIIQYIFRDTFQQYHGEEKIDTKVIVVMVTAAVSLLMISYLGHVADLILNLSKFGFIELANSVSSLSDLFPNERLFELSYWTLVRFLFFLALPVSIIKILYRESLAEYGLNIKKALSGYKIYFLFLLVMVPLVIGVSFTEAFQEKYPYYNPAGESLYPNFFIWQCMYLFQFFCLEFFFRGFMIHGTKQTLGFYSIFLMVIPYMMIHFEKPVLETTGAIIAGVFLGALSLRNNTIWQGVAIHCSVALTMDLAALVQDGYFN